MNLFLNFYKKFIFINYNFHPLNFILELKFLKFKFLFIFFFLHLIFAFNFNLFSIYHQLIIISIFSIYFKHIPSLLLILYFEAGIIITNFLYNSYFNHFIIFQFFDVKFLSLLS